MLMWLPFLLSALIILMSHFVCHKCLSLIPQVLNHFLIILKLIGLDYLSTFSITTDLMFHDDDIDIVWQSFKDLFLSSLPMYVPVVVTHSAATTHLGLMVLSIISLNAYRLSRGIMRLTPRLFWNRGCLERNWHLLSVIGLLRVHIR